jgi:hypothetical protein
MPSTQTPVALCLEQMYLRGRYYCPYFISSHSFYWCLNSLLGFSTPIFVCTSGMHRCMNEGNCSILKIFFGHFDVFRDFQEFKQETAKKGKKQREDQVNELKIFSESLKVSLFCGFQSKRSFFFNSCRRWECKRFSFNLLRCITWFVVFSLCAFRRRRWSLGRQGQRVGHSQSLVRTSFCYLSG